MRPILIFFGQRRYLFLLGALVALLVVEPIASSVAVMEPRFDALTGVVSIFVASAYTPLYPLLYGAIRVFHRPLKFSREFLLKRLHTIRCSTHYASTCLCASSCNHYALHA
jgi:hypothetical protein